LRSTNSEHQYNYLLADRFDWWEMNRCPINACPLVCTIALPREQPEYYGQKRSLVSLKTEREWYKDIHADVLQDMVKRVDLAMKRFIKGDSNGKRSGKPRFKGKNRYRTFAYQRVKPDCIQGNRIELPKLGKIKFIQHRPIPDGFVIKRALATLKADGWYATLTLEDVSVPDNPTNIVLDYHSLKTRSSYWQLLPYIRPQWKTIAQAFACTLGVTVFWPIQAALAGQIANLIGQGNMVGLAQLAGVLALVFLVQKILMYGQDSLMAKAALFVALDLRKQVYAHLQRLNLSYFETAQTGDLTYRLTEDIDRIGEVVNKVFHDFIPCVLQLIVVLGYMIYLNWQLTLATFLVAPLMGVLIGWFGEQMLKFSRRSQNRISNLSALLTEVFSGIRLVQAFAAEEYEIARFAQEAEHNRQAKYAAERLKAIQNPVVGFMYAMSVLLLFFLGGWQISRAT
jgi:hypothetical protein